jgi:hypothetical protein
MFVLAVKIDEMRRDLPGCARRGNPSVDAALRTAGAGEFS